MFGISGYLVFASWRDSSEKIGYLIQDHIHKEIFRQIDKFIDVPVDINKAAYRLIQTEIVNMADKQKRDVFFANLIQSTNEDVYSVSFGGENGDYYGARRNSDDDIEVYENNLHTGGKTRYYKVRPDLSAGELILETGRFDPRTREWYKYAKNSRQAVFSPVYKHFVIDDLALSASIPVFGKNNELMGVMGSHLTLSRLNNRLKDIVAEHEGIAYIVEKKTGLLIANSQEKPNFQQVDNQNIQRKKITDMDEQEIADAFARHSAHQSVIHSNKPYYIVPIEYSRMGLEWVILVGVPQGAFMAGLMNSIYFSALLTLALLMVSIFMYERSMAIILRPVRDLTHAAERFAAGDFSVKAQVLRRDEIGILATVFNNMAEQLRLLIHSLENKIRDRTKELEAANKILKLRTEEVRQERDSAVKNYRELNTLHDIAAKVQEGFLPAAFENRHLKVKHIFRPIQSLSGDALDFEWIDETQTLCGYIVDISGHGLIAALQATILNGIIHQRFFSKKNLAEKMQDINQASLRYFSDASYATVLYFELDCIQGFLKVSTGGINVFWASTQERTGYIQIPGSLVGAFSDHVEYSEMVLQIHPGDIFVFGSDGLFDLVSDGELQGRNCDLIRDYLEEACCFSGRKDDASAICIEIKQSGIAYDQMNPDRG